MLAPENAMKRIAKLVLIAIGSLIALCIVSSIIGGRDNTPSSTAPRTSDPPAVRSVPAHASPVVSADSGTSGPWANPDFVRFTEEGKACPLEFWAVLNRTPGKDEFEAKANVAKRAALEKKVKASTYIVVLESFRFSLSDYDFQKGQFMLEGPSVFSCDIEGVDSTAVALRPPRAVENREGMKRSDDNLIGILEWQAEPLRFPIKMAEGAAQAFRRDNQSGLGSARPFHIEVAFSVIGGDEHKRTVRGPNEGETQEVGAGLVVKAAIKGVRVSMEGGSRVYLDTLPESQPSK